jgi:Ca2+-binding EF-hand superfamily protein
MYDINGDGKITRSEMRQAVKRFLESVRKMKKAQYQQMAKFMEVSKIKPILVFRARVNAT